VLLPLPLRFRADKTLLLTLRCTTLSRKKHLLARDPGAKRLIGRPQEALLCTTATNVFCAKAKRQQQMFSVRQRQSAQTERKSTPHYDDEPKWMNPFLFNYVNMEKERVKHGFCYD